MKTYDFQDIRNICLVGSHGDGKTTIAEALLFNAGVINRMGKIEEGNTVCDCTDEEVERRLSINVSTAFFEHSGRKVNMLVAPGYPDFIGEVYSGLAVADTAVFVISADTGMTPAGENIWEYLEEKKIPTVIFVNKIDRDNLDYGGLLRGLREQLGGRVAPVTMPDATGQGLSRIVNLLEEQAPPEYADWKDTLVEAESSADDTLLEEYLEGKEITPRELKTAMQHEIRERTIFPVLCGSAARNIGLRELAGFIADYLPPPRPPDGEHLSALIYKTVSEPGMGQLNLARLYAGSLRTGEDVYNYTRQSRERVGQLCCVQGRKRNELHEAPSGDFVALLKLRDTRTNDILGAEKHAPGLDPIMFPGTVYDRAIATPSRGDEEKVGTALAVVAMENPTIRHRFNPETRQMVVSGMGSLQLEIMAQRLKTRYGVSVELKAPGIPYKETIRGKADVQGKYKRQTGGHGQYGDCWLRLDPLERGKGFEFVDKIVGGVIPKNFVPAIEKGVREAMEQGVVAGYPVVDVRVTVYDGSYHDVDSSDMAFKIAGAMALRKGVTEARPVMLEPIMDLEVVIPETYMGAVKADLNSRRGRVTGLDKAGNRQVIRAQVPMGEIFQYATDLRSLTKGSGRFSTRIARYEEAPPAIMQPMLDSYQKSRSAEEK